jgi:hypothetical protein
MVYILILAGVIWFVHTINPGFNDHKRAIAPDTLSSSEMWHNLAYKDYFVLSFTNGLPKESMVSFGLCGFVRIVDEEWAAKNKKP